VRRAQVKYLSVNRKNFVGDLSGTLARYLVPYDLGANWRWLGTSKL